MQHTLEHKLWTIVCPNTPATTDALLSCTCLSLSPLTQVLCISWTEVARKPRGPGRATWHTPDSYTNTLGYGLTT
ncbi:hypothetical protein HaLaN_22736 [Haematococcus lacustris]|uniref:Uncharacterized protein n=1 Tax=Haematococcus lacustris TaxID=44745 RepID=A0A699ZPU8_HAELA|nr:hypothetical protein HaLaN_22736 [Haematococcus lacustris]